MFRPPRIQTLTQAELEMTHQTSLHILHEVGVKLNHDRILEILAGRDGISIDFSRKIVRFSEKRIHDAVTSAGKRVKLYGRNPEQALPYGYGYVSFMSNIGESDSKLPDYQSGFERAFTMLFGVSAGVEAAGCLGIVGADQGSSLLQLVMDNEMAAYFRRLWKGFDVNEEKLAFDIVKKVGPGGNFLFEEHTVAHFREEIWIPELCDRQHWQAWESSGKKDTMERAQEKLRAILTHHKPQPVDELLKREFERIVKAAEADLLP
ncbi:MAG: trimethylamine methyltransferase family protein [Spirochaetota bacterium]